MFEEALAGLASAGGTALVAAMVTDGWESTRRRFSKILGRGSSKRTEAAEAQLDQSRESLLGLCGAEMIRTQAEQRLAWQERLTDFLVRHPDSVGELRKLVTEIQMQITSSAGKVEQHAVAFGNAQQAVLGHGTQNVSFGGRHEPSGQG